MHYIGYNSSYDEWKETGELEVYGGGFQLESYIATHQHHQMGSIQGITALAAWF